MLISVKWIIPWEEFKEHAVESHNFKSRFKSKFHAVFKISTKLLQAEQINTNPYWRK
jgi:hypothetical protein